MKAQDGEGQVLQQAFQSGQQVGLADALAGGHQFELGHAVHRVDVIDPLEAVEVALVDAVDADEARTPLGGRSAALADGHAVPLGLGPHPALGLIAGLGAQVVQVRHRQVGQALVARIPVEGISALQQVHGGRSRQGAVQGVGLGQQGHVQGAELAGKPVGRRPIALGQHGAVAGPAHQPGELLARVAGGVLQVAQDHTLVAARQLRIAQALEQRADERVALGVVVQGAEPDLRGALEKGAQLRHAVEPRFVHVDHHVRNDRPKTQASDSYLVGNTRPRSDSYHVGRDCTVTTPARAAIMRGFRRWRPPAADSSSWRSGQVAQLVEQRTDNAPGVWRVAAQANLPAGRLSKPFRACGPKPKSLCRFVVAQVWPSSSVGRAED